MKLFAGCKIAATILCRGTLAVMLLWTYFQWSYLLAWWLDGHIHGTPAQSLAKAFLTGLIQAFALLLVIGWFSCIGWPWLKKCYAQEIGAMVEQKKAESLRH